MTTFTGTAATPDIQLGNDPYTSANLFATRDYYTGDTNPAVYVGGDVAATGITTPYPDPYSTTFTGTDSFEFIDDWYYRIHFIPAAIDLGNLVSSQERSLIIWNAFFTIKALTALTGSGLDGITVTPPAALSSPPDDMAALGLYTYTLGFSLAGPPTVTASLTWTIAGVDYVVPITGRRVIAFAFPPNWARGVDETLEFKSTVSMRHGGSEQRASTRSVARRTFDYTTQLRGKEAQRFDSALHGWHGRLFALPLWPEQTSLTTDVVEGDTILDCDTADRSFEVGGLCAVFASSSQVEIREIESVSPAGLVLTSGLSAAWPIGSRVYPAVVSALTPSLSGTRLSDSLVEVPVRLTCEPGVTPANISGVAAATYQGVELDINRVNWASGVEFNWDSDYALQDTGTGKFGLLPRSGFSQYSKSHNWTLEGLAKVTQFRGWLSRRSGRTVPVYVPSDFDDFTLAANVLSSDTGIDCQQNDYEMLVDGALARRDVLIQLKNGTNIARRVFSAQTSEEGLTRLVFTESVGFTFTPSDVRRISFLGLYRLGSDSITLSWLSRGVVTAKTTLVNTTT